MFAPLGTEYYYAVSVAGAMSTVFHFNTAPDASTLPSTLPHQFIVYGDLGSSMSMPAGSSTCMPYVARDVREGIPDAPRRDGPLGPLGQIMECPLLGEGIVAAIPGGARLESSFE